MFLRFSALIVIVLTTQIVNSQTKNEIEFNKYASQQDSLMMDAYNKRDTSGYRKILESFIINFSKFDKSNQESFDSYLLNAYYNFACTYSITGNNQKALDYLEKSKYTDYGHLLVDSDLDNLRKEKRFEKCLSYAHKYLFKNLDTLKKASKYNIDDKTVIPAFTYQSANDSNLMKLRKLYKLDSIAGNGNEISRFINLMRWVHNIIRHDGSKGIPSKRNALDMITICKNENKTLNCRGLAILLNDVYLSMGYQSRFVTCLPKDSTDNDCHVINMVYSRTFQKWIWIDPTFEAYVMDEKGDLLSLQEVRERLINGKPLILNPDANWNRSSSQSKEGYLYDYMAKNLYRLQCPISSEFNYEQGVAKYCELIPVDYLEYIKKDKSKDNRIIISSDYQTLNPNLFWTKPE
ncbi:MAG: transglutaminase domain-containing protein [Bacteroidota bacterium]